MKTAFLLAALLALASGIVVALQLVGAVSFSFTSLPWLAGGFCAGGIVALAITDYQPRRRGPAIRTPRLQVLREKSWLRDAPSTGTRWSYHTISA